MNASLSSPIRKFAVALSLFAGIGLSGTAHAKLMLVVNSYTVDQISLTISGTFDMAAVGESREYLAIKKDWSNNVGVHTEWFNSTPTIVSDTIAFNGTHTGAYVQNAAYTWNDAVFWENPFGSIAAGTTMSGTIVLRGVGAFNLADADKLQLVSGFNRPANHDDWARLEASSAAVPEPASVALLGLGLAGLLAARRKKSA